MSVARVYRITAQTGKEAELASAIEAMAAMVRAAAGCGGVTLLQDRENPTNFLFIEKWAAVDDHKRALESFPPDAFAPIGAVMAGPPEGSYSDWVFG